MSRPLGLPPAPGRVWVAIATAFGVLTTLALAGIGAAGCDGGCSDAFAALTAQGTGLLPLLAGLVVWITIAAARGPLPQRAAVVVFGLVHATIAFVWVVDGALGLGGLPGAAWGAPTALLAAAMAFVALVPRFARQDAPIVTAI